MTLRDERGSQEQIELERFQGSMASRESEELNVSTPESDNENREAPQDYPQGFFGEEIMGSRGKMANFFHKVWYGPSQPEDPPPPQLRWLSSWENFPTRVTRIPMRIRMAFLACYLTFWLGLWYYVQVPYMTVPPYQESGDTEVMTLSCLGERTFWRGKNAACGMDKECPSLDTTKDVLIRCPALCDRGSWTYSFIPVGGENIKYRGYYVGGGTVTESSSTVLTHPYRADSFPCGAAVHAGLVSPFFGGCARISYESGPQSSFASTKGHYGVSDSVLFPSFFDKSYVFKTLNPDKSSEFHHCKDPRLLILVMNIFLGIPVAYIASGVVFYWVLTVVGFWTICLTSDPPLSVDPGDSTGFAALVSVGMERFLPSCFILYVLWKCSAKRTLQEPQEPHDPIALTRLVLWYPLFWLGIVNNLTFDRLPVDRLTIADLKSQPGAIFAVGGIILTIALCAVIQAYQIWRSGRFQKYLLLYLLFICGLIVLGNLPNLTLRVHHYILAMLLLPGCATRGRTAIAFQGILVGLFLLGAARWGYDSIVETAESLRRDDPGGGIVPPLITGYVSGVLQWKDPVFESTAQRDLNAEYDAVSVLINDLEYFVGQNISALDLQDLFNSTDLKSLVDTALHHSDNVDIFIRIGRKIFGTNWYSDFTQAAVLKWPSGNFSLPPPGLT